jgi:MFS family permease
MMWVDGIQAALVGILLLMTFANLSLGWEMVVILTVNFLLVAVDQFYNQAGFPLIIDLVGQPQIGKAISRVLVFVSIGTLIGPAVGAPLVVFWGPRWALLINMISFIVSLALIFAIKAPKIEHEAQAQEHKAFWPEFFSGVRFLVQSPFLRVMVIALAIETLGSSAINGLNIFFVVGTLHAPIALFGLIATALGIGTLIGSTVANKLIERFGDGRVFWISLLLDGLLIMGYSRLGAFLPALILIFLMGIPAGTINVVLGPMIARSTPREMMGRTNAARVSLITIAGFAGALSAGWLDTTLLRNFHLAVLGMNFGSIDTLFLVGGAIAALSGLYAMRYLGASRSKEAAMAEAIATASATPSEE